MRNRRILIACLFVLLAAPGAKTLAGAATVEDVAREFVTLLAEQKFAQAVERYDQTTRSSALRHDRGPGRAAWGESRCCSCERRRGGAPSRRSC